MISVGKTVRHLRQSLCMTQQQMADALGVTNVHLSHIENSKSFPSQDLMNRFREAFEVDLYILAWCSDEENVKQIPQALRKHATALSEAWRERLETILKRHRMGGH